MKLIVGFQSQGGNAVLMRCDVSQVDEVEILAEDAHAYMRQSAAWYMAG